MSNEPILKEDNDSDVFNFEYIFGFDQNDNEGDNNDE